MTDIFHHKSFPASKPPCNCVIVTHQYAYQQIPFLKLTHAGICKCLVTQVIEVLKYIGERIGNKEWPLIRSKRSTKRRVLSAHTWVLLLLTYVRLGGGVELLFEAGRWWVVFPRGSRGRWRQRELNSREVSWEDNLLPERQPTTSTPSPAFHLLERADKHRTSCLPLHKTPSKNLPEPKADTPKQELAYVYSNTHTHTQAHGCRNKQRQSETKQMSGKESL